MVRVAQLALLALGCVAITAASFYLNALFAYAAGTVGAVKTVKMSAKLVSGSNRADYKAPSRR